MTIDDDILALTGLADLPPGEARFELLLGLRAVDRLTYRQVAALADVTPARVIEECRRRGIPWIHVGGTTEAEALEYLRQEKGFLVDDAGGVALDQAVFPNAVDGRLPAVVSPAAGGSADVPAPRAARAA